MMIFAPARHPYTMYVPFACFYKSEKFFRQVVTPLSESSLETATGALGVEGPFIFDSAG